jgi:hypothetical protein
VDKKCKGIVTKVLENTGGFKLMGQLQKMMYGRTVNGIDMFKSS